MNQAACLLQLHQAERVIEDYVKDFMDYLPWDTVKEKNVFSLWIGP